ncbi:MAG TPA: hypothetical protein VNL38_04325, partial [Candidatus Nitrosotenuis sp.]|nr:hypothetical protein [Candidatus Nitrosotenuis sp.]
MICPSASAHLVARKASSAFVLALVYLFAAAPLDAQSFKVQGGTSSVFQGHGGTLEVRGANYTGRISLGLLGDGPRLGFYFARPMHGALWGFGDQNIPFVLPTDLFNNTYYFLGRGASMSRGDRT